MIKQTSPNVPAVLAVYLIAFLQGLTLVSFPASSAVLRQMHGFTDAQYGAIFLPQVTLAVLGAVIGYFSPSVSDWLAADVWGRVTDMLIVVSLGVVAYCVTLLATGLRLRHIRA